MPGRIPTAANLDPRAVAFYRHAIEALREASVPFLVGGAMAGWDRFVRRSRFGRPDAPPARFRAQRGVDGVDFVPR